VHHVPRPSAGTILAVIAIVLALTGTGAATAVFVEHDDTITSIRQIAPNVRAALRGHTGPRGRRGPTGRPGRRGPTGHTGLAGTTGLTGLAGPTGPAGAGGPAGSTGRAGQDGAAGPAGPPGPVAAQTSHADAPTTVPPDATGRLVVVGPVPATGRYVAIAKLSIVPTGPGEVSCRLEGVQSTVSGNDATFASGDGVEQTMTLTYPGDFEDPLTPDFAGFRVACVTPSDTSAIVRQAKITILQATEATLVDGTVVVE
jgi:hypothetical protein